MEYALFESRVLLADLARRLDALAAGGVPSGPTGPAGAPAGTPRGGRAPARPAGGPGDRHVAAAARPAAGT
ncbi:MAG: hypothetical protein ACYDIE_13875, partial [Candidatus Krumholzibacteriia bacterium]